MTSFARTSDYIKSPLDMSVRTLETVTLTNNRVSTFHFEFSITSPNFRARRKVVNPLT